MNGTRARLFGLTAALSLLAFAAPAGAQGRRKSAPPPPQPSSTPAGDDEDAAQQAASRAMQSMDPTPKTPDDPLAMSPEVRARIGTDTDGAPAAAAGETQRSYFPFYEERTGDRRIRLLPPLYLEETRGLPSPGRPAPAAGAYDRQSLSGLLFYQRRSLKLDADVLFPLAWRVRDRENHVTVVGPVAHREAPHEHDNWVAPLFFEGSREKGGYFHSPVLLTTTHWSEEGAFTLVGPYFRDRTGSDVDWGVAPLLFRGDNGDREGNRRTYTLVPPLLFYTGSQELEESSTTVIGPVILQETPKRSIVDVAPFFFHIEGKPQSGGVKESHTTLFPLFHYGHTEDSSLFVLPGYLRRITPKTDTMLTPLFSHATTRRGSTSFTAVGPVLPLFYSYEDKDIELNHWAAIPFFYRSKSPRGSDWLTPLVGRFEDTGLSRTWWFFPNVTINRNIRGWETDIHPLVYLGRKDRSSHTVAAPIFWDFASPKGRTTVGFPLYWRFAETADDSVIQVAANTLYMQKHVSGGTDWQFHLLPLFSYGEDPKGYFGNLLFGLAGYTREGASQRIRAFWVPIEVGTPPPPPPKAAASR
ncbi:MAG: hypothetical protein U0235_12440 [Polyangiaceae bacterium]